MAANSIPENLSDKEKELFYQVAEGDEEAFSDLFNLFLPKLHPFIVKFLKSEPAAEEVIQETFIRVWLNRDKLGEIENPGGWLYKVASNECYNYLRKTATQNKFLQTIHAKPEAVRTTYEWVDLKDLKRLIGEAVEQLPLQRKRIYQMSRDQGKTIPEIAEALQLSPNTVKNALVTALKFIREYLSKHGIVFLLIYCLQNNNLFF